MKNIERENKELKAVFEIVDALRFDLTQCGKMLSEANGLFYILQFEHTDEMLSMRTGTGVGSLSGNCRKGETVINITTATGGSFTPSAQVLIYDKETGTHEIKKIQRCDGSRLILEEGLGENFREHSTVVLFAQIEWTYNLARGSFSRIADGVQLKWLINVTDFNVTYYPELVSVLFRIEMNKKTQVRGYIPLENMQIDP